MCYTLRNQEARHNYLKRAAACGDAVAVLGILHHIASHLLIGHCLHVTHQTVHTNNSYQIELLFQQFRMD